MNALRNFTNTLVLSLEHKAIKDALYFIVICSLGFTLVISALSLFCSLFIYSPSYFLGQPLKYTIIETIAYIIYMPIAITQKHVLLCPDISTWGVAYAMCVSSFYEAPFSMASLVAHIIVCFIFAHNTLSGALIRLDVKNHTFWYRVVVGFLSVTFIVVMAIYWDIMPHWISF